MSRFMMFADRLVRAPDDGAGAGGGAAGAGGAAAGAGAAAGDGQAAGAGAAGGGAGGAGAPATPYRPDGLPDHLFGASERETIDKLFGAYKPARDKLNTLGELGEVPSDPSKYAFEPSDKLKPFVGDLAADPVMKLVREAAKEAGIRDKQFAPFLSRVMEAMVDGDLVQPPVDLAAEKAALVPADASALDDQAKDAAVDRRIRQNHGYLEMWKARGLDEGAVEQLGMTLDTAAGNKAIEWFAAQMRAPQPALGGTPAGAFTQADIDARMRDPKGKVGTATFDPAFAAETDRMFKALYPN